MLPNAASSEGFCPDDFSEIHSLSIDSRMEEVRLVGEAARNIAEKLKFVNANAGTVELAAVEAVNNTIEHAHKYEPGKTITVVFSQTASCLSIAIKDTGPAIPEETQKTILDNSPIFPDTDVEVSDLSEGGWGLSLIKSLVDSLDYRRESDINVMTLIFDLH